MKLGSWGTSGHPAVSVCIQWGKEAGKWGGKGQAAATDGRLGTAAGKCDLAAVRNRNDPWQCALKATDGK